MLGLPRGAAVPRELPLAVYRHLPRLQREAYRCIIDHFEDAAPCEESQRLFAGTH